VKAALWRFGSGLIALPAQVISLFLVFHGAGEAVGPLYQRLLPTAPRRGRAREGAALFGLLLLGIPVAIAMSGAALTMIITLVRLVWHPTLGRALVAVGALVLGDLVLRGGGYLLRRMVFPPLPEDQPARVTRPGSALRSSAPAARRGRPRPR
jgi:hypothetical protein